MREVVNIFLITHKNPDVFSFAWRLFSGYKKRE